ncbi:ADP-ribosylglycohydrolase family protein [uncultured Ruegeria sp.]|uniref:ADP-ribosylglycohydrolase family protein n=1 Tax=uncultured Ruegeria sp. TaxID=259304 RepID=UPI002628FFFD|nr:ADP-ribosylglycohydrolase family protein [uncultured Ruegeria sp.]
MTKRRSIVTGALVADAASLGLHWLYDQARIQKLVGQTPEFCATNAADFEGVPSYFAHPLKQPGDLSQYGEQCLVLLRALASQSGAYDQEAYNNAFVSHFGYGGTYCGYIDGATRGTLDNLANGKSDQVLGAQDTQLPAIAKLPPLIAAGQEAHAEEAIRTTNQSDLAVSYGRVACAMLIAARDNGTVGDVVEAAFEAADNNTRPTLELARASTDRDTCKFTEEVGMSCELEYGLPSVLHNLLTTKTYQEAIRTNILAGGDNCGRAILLGGVLGATHGIPESWVSKVHSMNEVEDLFEKLGL